MFLGIGFLVALLYFKCTIYRCVGEFIKPNNSRVNGYLYIYKGPSKVAHKHSRQPLTNDIGIHHNIERRQDNCL
jgi:Na+-transporting methylmalonyl-CoA/oxaloacetate decarboxylase gamma subunit